MQTLRYTRQKTRALLFSTISSSLPSSSGNPFLLTTTIPNTNTNNNNDNGSQSDVYQKDRIAQYFHEWFISRKKPLYEHIFEILRNADDNYVDSALSRFNLPLSEALFLDVLNYDKNDDIMSCLKFFVWAGRQRGFHHTRATFNAIFRVFVKAKKTDAMFNFMQNHMKDRYVYKVNYNGVLVVGYALAGKCEVALQVFGRMRFGGVDLDGFAYHVLLNSLVEQGCFEVVETLAREIKNRGYQNEVTHSIMVKNYIKQNELERGEEYLRSLVVGDKVTELSGMAIATFVGALCKENQFERAALMVEGFRKMGLVSMEPAYGVWIKELVNAGNLDGALAFLNDKRAVEGYVPDVFRFNSLVCRLLRENRFEEVFDLLVEMKNQDILPDDVTMNAILCLLCKVGRWDIAMDLYNSRAEFGLSVNCMAYHYLINTLLGDASVDEAYGVFRNSIDHGYFPGEKTIFLIADALCSEGKHDKMKELLSFTLDRNIMPRNRTYDKLISALCAADRVEEGYWVHNLLNRNNKASAKRTYTDLVSAFSKSSKAQIAARLLIEMQEKGYTAHRSLIRQVICCICETENPEKLFFNLFEKQLAIPHLSPSIIYQFFIDGAGHAGKPGLATQVYERMKTCNIVPDWRSGVLLLQSYLKSGNIIQALRLFRDLSKKWSKRKLWHSMIVGLCKANHQNYAAQLLEDMKSKGLRPSIECYEELIKLYCGCKHYHEALDLVNDMTKLGRPISTFIGNVFLLHALRGTKLYEAWASYSSHTENLTPASWRLGDLIVVFSGCVEGNYNEEDVEKLIERCFYFDLYTNNMLLRRASMRDIDYACKYFGRVYEKGYEPNQWSYDIIVHGLFKVGRNRDAKLWMDEMFHKGFKLTETTQKIIQR